MATPVEWLPSFQVNTGTAATGDQTDPHIIGLSNGNILVAWAESGNGLIAPQAGTDIIGKIYDAQGNVVRDPYRLNADFFRDRFGVSLFLDNKQDFDIAATNDGGFMLVYVDRDISLPVNSDIRWERHDAAGDRTLSATLASETSGSQGYKIPKVTVNQLTNESVVTYTESLSLATNIKGISVSSGGELGASSMPPIITQQAQMLLEMKWRF